MAWWGGRSLKLSVWLVGLYFIRPIWCILLMGGKKARDIKSDKLPIFFINNCVKN